MLITRRKLYAKSVSDCSAVVINWPQQRYCLKPHTALIVPNRCSIVLLLLHNPFFKHSYFYWVGVAFFALLRYGFHGRIFGALSSQFHAIFMNSRKSSAVCSLIFLTNQITTFCIHCPIFSADIPYNVNISLYGSTPHGANCACAIRE